MAKLFNMPVPKAAMSAALIASMAMSAAPAAAQSRDYSRDRDGISAGEVIAGVVVLGGLAAILSSGNNRDDRYYRDDRYRNDARYGYGYDYRRYGDSRAAVNQCARAVERDARRYGRTQVTQITSIDRKRDGYRLRGEVVADQGRDRNFYGRDRDRYDRGRYGNDRYDRGRFTCEVKYGRVQDVKISGLKRR
jgi:hypothetical protein